MNTRIRSVTLIFLFVVALLVFQWTYFNGQYDNDFIGYYFGSTDDSLSHVTDPVPAERNLSYSWDNKHRSRYESADVWRSPDTFGSYPFVNLHRPRRYHRRRGGRRAGRVHGYYSPYPPPPPPSRYNPYLPFKPVDYLRQPIIADYDDINPSNVYLMIKTGASVLWQRLPTHLWTTLTRVDNFGLYSDAPSSIAGYEVIDVLANLSTSTLQSSEFEMYRYQRTLHDDRSNSPYADISINHGWDLDKFKNIPMLAHAYTVSPDSDWYVFMDADSYFLWDNLLADLRRRDPNSHLYMGSIVGSGKYQFAHGGSGVVLSHKTMASLFDGENDPQAMVSKYENRTFDECCGDLMVAYATIDEARVSGTPNKGIQGEPYWNIVITPDRWCDPLLSLHHMDSHDIEVFWEYEQIHRLNYPDESITYSHIYRDFVLPFITEKMENWDNDAKYAVSRPPSPEHEHDAENNENKNIKFLDDDDAWTSFEACQRFCEINPDCLSFRLKQNPSPECYISNGIVMGRAAHSWQKSAVKNNAVDTTSGWMVDRIRQMANEMTCGAFVEGDIQNTRSEGWALRERQSKNEF